MTASVVQNGAKMGKNGVNCAKKKAGIVQMMASIVQNCAKKGKNVQKR